MTSGLMGTPLPVRACGTCRWWDRTATSSVDGVVAAECAVHDEVRRGGDRCGDWKPLTVPEVGA